MILRREKHKASVIVDAIREKYFTMPTENGFLIATSQGEYTLLLLNDNTELYLYRLLDKAEYKKFKKNGLPDGWVLETNPTKMEFAMVYIHSFEKRPTAAMLQKQVFFAIDNNI